MPHSKRRPQMRSSVRALIGQSLPEHAYGNRCYIREDGPQGAFRISALVFEGGPTPMYLFSRVSRPSTMVPVWLARLVVAGAVAVMGCTPQRSSADRAETRDADGDESTADQSAGATDTAAPGAVAAEDHSAALQPGTQATARVWSF